MSQEDSVIFDRVTIVGPGLLGASIGMGLKERHLVKNLWVWVRSEEKIHACDSVNWCDYATLDLQKAVAGSDLVILCTPVETIINHIKLISDWVKPGSIVTDVGSLKNKICLEAEKSFKDKKAYFIGSHPMTGSEKSGMAFATSEILFNKTCIVTPIKTRYEDALVKLEKTWKELGMHVTRLHPKKHDQVVGCISHLPHLVAVALINAVERLNPKETKLSGDGLRDTTRVAAGNPEMWKQIILGNRDNLSILVSEMILELKKVKDAVDEHDESKIEKLLTTGKQARERLDDR